MLLGRNTLARLMALATVRGREARELARAALVRRRLSALLAITGPRPTRDVLVAIVDSLRARHGVEAVCAELPMASRDYYAMKSGAMDTRWRRLVGQARSQRGAGAGPAANARPARICGVEPPGALPTA